LKDLRDVLLNHGLKLQPASPSPHPTEAPTNPDQPTICPLSITQTTGWTATSSPPRSTHRTNSATRKSAVSRNGAEFTHATSPTGTKATATYQTSPKPIGTEVDGGRTIVPGLSNHGRSYASVIYEGCDDAPEVRKSCASRRPSDVQSPIADLKLSLLPQTRRQVPSTFPFSVASSSSPYNEFISRLPSDLNMIQLVDAFYLYFTPL